MDSMRFMADNPNTLKRQPTGSFKPVSAIGAQRQTIGVDKIASKAEVIIKKLASDKGIYV